MSPNEITLLAARLLCIYITAFLSPIFPIFCCRLDLSSVDREKFLQRKGLRGEDVNASSKFFVTDDFLENIAHIKVDDGVIELLARLQGGKVLLSH